MPLLRLGFVAVIALTFAAPSSVGAQTLRRAARDADVVCVAQVVSRRAAKWTKGEPRPRWSEFATLAPVEVIKGQAKGSRLVGCSPNATCAPPPARFSVGELVVVFLKRSRVWADGEFAQAVSEGEPIWIAVGAARGVRVLRGRDKGAAFVHRVRQAVQLQRRQSSRAETTAWLVDCVFDETTRWDALLDLLYDLEVPYPENPRPVRLLGSAGMRRLRALGRGKPISERRKLVNAELKRAREQARVQRDRSPFAAALRPEHRERLWLAVRDDPQLLDPHDHLLVDLVAKWKPRSVARRLLLELKRMTRLEHETYRAGAVRYMRKAAELLEWERGLALAKEATCRDPWPQVEAFLRECEPPAQED